MVAGHSYGGQIMTALGTMRPTRSRWSTSPRSGWMRASRSAGCSARSPTPALAHLEIDEPGFAWLPEDDFVNHFAADIDPAKARVMYAVQQPLSTSTLGDVMGVPAWKSLPTWYLVAPTTRRSRPMPSASSPADGRDHVEIASGHCAMVSHPEDVVMLVETAVWSEAVTT